MAGGRGPSLGDHRPAPLAGADFEESLVSLAVLVLLLTNRRDFQAASDWSSQRSALIALGAAAVGVIVVTTGSYELFSHIDRDSQSHLSWWAGLQAVSERMVGIQTVPLPHKLDRFLAPSLLAIGLTLVATSLFLLTRPVVDRRLSAGRAAEFRARDIVRRHGKSTLDYFALRIRQALVLPSGQPCGLRRVRGCEPHLSGSHRASQRA